MDSSILHKCFTINYEKQLITHRLKIHCYILIHFLKKLFSIHLKMASMAFFLHITLSQYFQIFQDLEGKSVVNKDI